MAVTIEHRTDGSWNVSSLCRTKAEAFAKAAKIEEVRAEAFIPVEPVHHAHEAPMPPYASLDADDDLGLTAGKAGNPVNQDDEE